MGRRENPIVPCERELEKLARHLREHRARAGLSYQQLAARSGCSASTLIRAASGELVPKLKTVRAYAGACGGDPDETERLWKRARYRAARSEAEGPVPHPRYIRNFAELRAALVDLYRKDGARPYRELERASDGVLAHATVGRFLRQEGGRPTRQFVLAFAQTCGMRGMALREWGQAWDRAEEQRGGLQRNAGPGRLFTAVLPGRRPMLFFSDPDRTPDGQEVRRLTPAGPWHEAELISAQVRDVLFTPITAPTSDALTQEQLRAARGARRTQPYTQSREPAWQDTAEAAQAAAVAGAKALAKVSATTMEGRHRSLQGDPAL
ncbi:hypothetical protein B5181_16760 [Streptomyces sp. 4F]|nr:hypothetical protein B5181_16760 [Streptomyces sp. 4F]